MIVFLIRIFTDLALSEVELTGPEYRHCADCSHWVHVREGFSDRNIHRILLHIETILP